MGINIIMITLLLLALASSLGVALSRDNFYAALYLALTTSLVGALYGLLGLAYGFILIFLIYVGATITITVILAAIYRRVPIGGGVGRLWVIPMVLFVATVALAYYANPVEVGGGYGTPPGSFAQYRLLILSLFSLLILLAIGTITYYSRVRGGEY
jgi:NADH-quinone oxidoreductase subunit J